MPARGSVVLDTLVESGLRELADAAYQRRIWLASGGPEVSSFEECCCRLFDDSGLGDALESDDTLYTPGIDARFRELRTVLHRVNAARVPEDVIADPFLDRARALARDLLERLRGFGADRPG